MTVKLLNEHNLEFLGLKGGCTGSSEFTLVKMSNYWKSYAAAHLPAHADPSFIIPPLAMKQNASENKPRREFQQCGILTSVE